MNVINDINKNKKTHMNKNKNLIIIASLLSAMVVFAENTFVISGTINRLDAYTLFVLLRSVAIVGIAYVAYLSFAQNKKKWALLMSIVALWLHASLIGGSVSLIPMALNIVAFGILTVSIFSLRLEKEVPKG